MSNQALLPKGEALAHFPTADRNQLETFFQAMFCRAEEGFLSLRGFLPTHRTAFIECLSIHDKTIVDALENLGSRAAGMENTVFCSPMCTFQSREGAKEKDIANGVCISVDLDTTDPSVGQQYSERLLGPATAVVESGGLWKNPKTGDCIPRLHLYWRLSVPTRTEDEHGRLKRVRKHLAELVGGDQSGAPVSHPFRWPGSWHTKDIPRMCQIIQSDREREVSLDYAEEALANESRKISLTGPCTDRLVDQQRSNQTKAQESEGYGKAALSGQLQTLQMAGQGERNTTLNKSAFNLGQLVGGGVLARAEVEAELLRNAVGIGLSETESQKAIKSGLEAGIEKPRTAPVAQSHVNQAVEGDLYPLPRLMSGSEVRALEIRVEWLIEGMVPKKAISILFGRGGIGKTTLTLQMANAISKGIPFFERRSQRVPVVYIDYENPVAVLSDRLERIHCDDVLFWPSSESPVSLDKDVSALFEILESYPEALFVFDTLRSSHTGDENDSKVMTRIVTALRKLRDKGATILVLHHTKKNDDKTYKGSTAILDLSDHIIGLYRTGENNVSDPKESSDRVDLNTYFLGTPTKTRFQPFSCHIKFDDEALLFSVSSDPIATSLKRIRELIPQEGIIQKDLLSTIQSKLGLGRNKGLSLLASGTDSYWTAVKDPARKNAITYRQFFSSPAPIEEEN